MTEAEGSHRPGLNLPDNLAVDKYRERASWNHLVEVSAEFTSERRLIVEELMRRPWFQRTSEGLQLELAKLPQEDRENHDGFLADLAGRPDEINGLEIVSLDELPRGNFALIPKFKVRNPEGNEYTYEYVSWRYGPDSGAKGIVFVKNGDEITHFIVLKGGKFATGDSEFDTVGGFVDPEDKEGIENIVKTTIEREVREELGVETLQVDNVFSLGKVHPDAGMTNNFPELFVAIIDASEATKISSEPLNPDQLEIRAGALIIPIAQLSELIKTNNDGLFLSAVARSAAHGIIGFDQMTSSSTK
jgi:hypothetical protein